MSSCSSTSKNDEQTPDGIFKTAEELEKDERFEEALQKFAEVKNKFPYSRFATSAELKIADIHFQRESFIEAQGAYQLFRELHPRHPDIDYVIFRLGLSYFNQLPSTIDRDLTVANRAITSFDDLMKNYPDSKYIKEAQEKKQAARKMLADKELYIADFYFKRKTYDSALARYEKVLSQFSTEGLNSQALLRGGISAVEAGDREKGQKMISRLLSEYGDSGESADGRAAKEKYGL